MGKSRGKGKGWLDEARRRMERKGTVGAFTRQARQHGMSVQEFASEVLRNPERYSEKTVKRARFAKTMGRIARRRKQR